MSSRRVVVYYLLAIWISYLHIKEQKETHNRYQRTGYPDPQSRHLKLRMTWTFLFTPISWLGVAPPTERRMTSTLRRRGTAEKIRYLRISVHLEYLFTNFIFLLFRAHSFFRRTNMYWFKSFDFKILCSNDLAITSDFSNLSSPSKPPYEKSSPYQVKLNKILHVAGKLIRRFTF